MPLISRTRRLALGYVQRRLATALDVIVLVTCVECQKSTHVDAQIAKRGAFPCEHCKTSLVVDHRGNAKLAPPPEPPKPPEPEPPPAPPPEPKMEAAPAAKVEVTAEVTSPLASASMA